MGAAMAYDPGALEGTLTAAIGEQPLLIAELRTVFFEAAEHHLVALRGAPDAVEWRLAAGRLNGLAASFGALRLMGVAAQAMRADRVDPVMLVRIERTVARLREA
ncbi:MAG: Hpt domain-containing protein [Sphingomonadaceae bacterium]